MLRSLAGPCWLLLWWMRQPGINQQTRSVIDTMQAAAIARMTITMMLTVTVMLSLVLFSTSGSHLLATSCITQVRRAWRFHVLEREVKFTAKIHQIYIRDSVVWHFVKTIIDTAVIGPCSWVQHPRKSALLTEGRYWNSWHLYMYLSWRQAVSAAFLSKSSPHRTPGLVGIWKKMPRIPELMDTFIGGLFLLSKS